MDSQEIELLLAKSEKNLKLEFFALPAMSWIISSGVMLFGMFSLSLEMIGASLGLTFISILFTSWYRSQLGEIRSQRADLFWRDLFEANFFGDAATRNLGQEITAFYKNDPRAEILPLSQAIRLTDTHYKQQQRLTVVSDRLAKLRSVQNALQDKTEQLRILGEEHPQGETRLQALQEDEAALDAMRGQIQASCHRLELIVSEAQKAQQMRQLHREISALSQENTRLEIVPAGFESESLLEIEHQITREIETFLRLERETDRHLREL